MANPQVEHGFIKIATGDKDNDILMALIGASLSSTEYQVVLTVIRKTWGWNKKLDWISYSQFVKITNKSRISIYNAITELVKKNILVKKTELGKITAYRLNKDFNSWIPVQKIKPVKKVELVKKTEHTRSENLTRLVKKTVPTKETITKDITTKEIVPSPKKYSSLKDISETDILQIAQDYKVSVGFVRLQWEKVKNYCSSKGKTYKNYKSALRNFVLGDMQRQVERRTDDKFRAIDATNV